ncbi:tetratricopeptide repeat protein [Microcoleus sp. Pol12A5]|uniref:tetratricopeptide repeat protein n=1 Tax=Microcoleus sp. Pol12A5 TaxID=3055392 RepID=UPI002FCF62BC
MQQLHGLLQDGSRVAIAAASGMGGIGKTELAWQYATFHREHNTYPAGIWWLFVREIDLAPQVLQKALRMGIQPPDTLDNLEERLQFCYEEWAKKTSGNALLVLDDVNDYRAVQRLLPRNPRFKVLLTARERLEEKTLQRLDLKKLRPLDAFKLLYEVSQAETRIVQEQIVAEKLCAWLEYLPLGIELVATFLKVEPDVSVAELLTQLQQKLLQDEVLTPVAAAFELSWVQLNAAEQQLAVLLSVFALAPMPWQLVESVVVVCRVEAPKQNWLKKLLVVWGKVQAPQQWYLLLDDRVLSQSRRRLVELSLLGRVEQKQYQLHALIREFFAAKLPGRADAENLRRSFAVVLTAVAKTIPQTVTLEVQERVKEALPHLEVVAEQWSHLLENSTDATWSSTGLARVAQGQSLWAEAEKRLTACLQMTEQRCGADHPSTAMSLNNLAGLYELTGRYAEAEPLFVRSLLIIEQQLGADHPSTAMSLNNLAELYKSTGRYAEAEPLFVRSLSIREQQLGADHPDTASSLNNLAGLYQSMRRYAEAEPLSARSLSIREQQLGADHPDTAMSLNNLAVLYKSMGRYAEAEPLYVRSLSICEQQLGADHPHTAQSLNNLAALYDESMGCYAEAEPLYVRSLSIREQQLGADHPHTAESLNNLARLYDESTGRYAEAEPLYLRALEIFWNRLGENHPNTQTARRNFIACLQKAISTGQDSQLSQHPTTQAMLKRLRETE